MAVTITNLIMEFFMKISRIKILLLATIALAFNAFASGDTIDALVDTLRARISNSAHAETMRTAVEEFFIAYNAIKTIPSIVATTSSSSTMTTVPVTLADPDVLETLNGTEANDLRILAKEVGRQKKSGTGNLDLYLSGIMEDLKKRIEAWFKAIIPAADDSTVIFDDTLVGSGNYGIHLGRIKHATGITLVIPADKTQKTIINNINGLLNNLRDQNVLRRIPTVAANHSLAAALRLPDVISAKSIHHIRSAAIAAVAYTIKEYVQAIIGIAEDTSPVMGRNILDSKVTLRNTNTLDAVITDQAMVPTDKRAAEFIRALGVFIQAQ